MDPRPMSTSELLASARRRRRLRLAVMGMLISAGGLNLIGLAVGAAAPVMWLLGAILGAELMLAIWVISPAPEETTERERPS